MTTDNLFEEKAGISIEGYQAFVPTTFIVSPAVAESYLAHGIAAEVGELEGVYAKYLRNDFDIFELNRRLRKELGDIMYFVVMLAHINGWDMRVIMEENMEKLKDRQRRGTLQGDGDDR